MREREREKAREFRRWSPLTLSGSYRSVQDSVKIQEGKEEEEEQEDER